MLPWRLLCVRSYCHLRRPRYHRMDIRSKLPRWITQNMKESHLNLSSDLCVSIARKFLREMSQPMSIQDSIGVSLLDEDAVRSAAAQDRGNSGFLPLRRVPAPSSTSVSQLIHGTWSLCLRLTCS